MRSGVPLCSDYTAGDLRALACGSQDAKQSRRLLALAAVAVQAWLAGEPETPIPWATADYVNGLASNGLQVRIDDLTKATCRAIRRGWAQYLEGLEASGQRRPHSRLLVKEAELWSRRIELLQSGELGVCRIHAAKSLQSSAPSA